MDNENVARAKAHGYRLWGLSGERFLSMDSQRVLTPEEVVQEIEREAENVQATSQTG